MYDSIQHQTKFRYSATISETTMAVRRQPRTESTQHCLGFELPVYPKARDQIHLAVQQTYIDYSIEEALGA